MSSALQDWAKKERKAELPFWQGFKSGMETTLVEFDETTPPKERRTGDKVYVNFRVNINGEDMWWGQFRDLASYRFIIKYLSAGIYKLNVSWDAGSNHPDIRPVDGSYQEGDPNDDE